MRALIVDDDASVRRLLTTVLAGEGWACFEAGIGADGLAACEREQPDVILLDIHLPDSNGLELLGKFLAFEPRPAVLIMTGSAKSRDAVTAMKKGAETYLEKPLELEELKLELQRISETLNLRREVSQLRQVAGGRVSLPSPALKEVEMRLAQVADKMGVPVLILGETGTGKEITAKRLHELGPRANGPFVELHCAALPETLIESELFGYEAGAFTDAKKPKPGLFEQARGGTVFLDEIGEISPNVQVKLLKVLEEKRARRLGGEKVYEIDARVVAATNKNLADEVQGGRFRSDLYYRLNVFSVTLPPLRERPEDIAVLAAYFLEKAGRDFQKRYEALPPDLLAKLKAYPWPGNIRELRNIIERMAIVARGPRLSVSDWPAELENHRSASTAKAAGPESEAEKIKRLLDETRWNRSEVAKMLGISRPTLLRRMKDFGLD